MKKPFYEINKAIRTQIRSRREFLNITQQELRKKIGIDFFGDENHFENDKTIITRLESIPKDKDNNELRNIDLEVLYYTCIELGLKLDPIFFPVDIPSLFENNAFKDYPIETTNDIKIQFLKDIYNNYDAFRNVLNDEKIKEYYNELLLSGLKTFLPPQISFISNFGAGTTSLIYLILGLKYEAKNLLSDNSDVLYVHSEYKPPFYPEDKNEFEFDKDTFCLQEIFRYRTDFTVKSTNNITVKFINTPILKYLTILDSKIIKEEISKNLFKDSLQNFIVDSNPALIADTIYKIFKILGIYKNYIIINSKKSFLLKKDEEKISTLILMKIKPSEMRTLNLKKPDYNVIIKGILSYDITNPESYYSIHNLMKDKIIQLNIPATNRGSPIYLWNDSAIPLFSLNLNTIKPIEQIERVYTQAPIEMIRVYCQQFPEYIQGFKDYLNNLKNKFPDITNTFIKEELNISFLNNLDFLVFKENTKCLNISKDFISKLAKRINKEIYLFLHSILWKNGLIDRGYINSDEIRSKFNNSEFYRSIILDTISPLYQEDNKIINEYIDDITNANRPTVKYFIKRFTEYKNVENQTLSEKITENLNNILFELKVKLNNVTEEYTYYCKDSVINDIECYIKLYEKFIKINKEIKKQIQEKIYPNETFL